MLVPKNSAIIVHAIVNLLHERYNKGRQIAMNAVCLPIVMLPVVLAYLPPVALAWAFVGGRLPHAFAQQLGVGLVVVQDLVDLSPVGQTGYASVVDEIVGLDLTAEVVVLVDLLLGVVAVHSPELHAALAAPVDGLLQLIALAHRPEDELVAILDEHAQGFGGEGPLRPDGGVAVLHNGSVKVDGDGHVLSFWLIRVSHS